MSDNVLKSAAEVTQRVHDDGLHGVMVQEVDLSADGLANTRAVDTTFRRVALHDADASRTVFSRTKFTECSARGARFKNALFRTSSFFNSELIEASFAGAYLSGSSFFNTRLGNGDFAGTRIQSTTFNSCELFGVNFARAVIMNSRFEAPERGNVTLDRANFSNAVIIDTDMMGANLFGASFKNALLIKVDLRHANITEADFDGARLIDVQIDLGQLEPGERRMIERAKFDDPWRNQGFMSEVLAPYSPEEMHHMLEYVLRTYIIEAAQPTSEADTFGGLLAGLKARFDFGELSHIRMRDGAVQVRHGRSWYDLGAPIEGASGGAPAAATLSDDDSGGGGDSQAGESAGRPSRRPDFDAPPAEEKSNRPPKHVGKSKRFRKLEMD